MAKPMDDRINLRFDAATKRAIESHAEIIGLCTSSWVRMIVIKELKALGVPIQPVADDKAAY
jgi:antitoxin component of RelBE/YafQ-DinJ toxin-antitoxin module